MTDPGGLKVRMRVRMASRRRLAALVLFALSSWLATAVPASADPCPNAKFRTGYSAYLPDCRAYEQVSPPDKKGYDINFGNDAVVASGDSITYSSTGAFAGSQANDFADQYLASRDASGWSTEGISPAHNPISFLNQFGYQGFFDDLTHMVLKDGDQGGATPGTVNLFLRNPDGSLELLTPDQPPVPAGQFPPPPWFDGASAGFSHILIGDNAPLTPNAPNEGPKLYEWANGTLTLVSVLPNGTASDGDAGSGIASSPTRAISTDGSRVYWTNGPGGIYLQQNGSSTEIDTSQCTSNPGGCYTGTPWTSYYWTATSDGANAYFTSVLRLTNDSTASFADYGDLYQYDANTGQLTDLTVDTTDPNGADVKGVVGASDDGEYIYFVAGGVLASGATAGQPNLYVLHGGATKFIATLSPNDQTHEWDLDFDNPFNRSSEAQISPDGAHLLFTSQAQLTGYDNSGHSEIYLYDASSGALDCLSCDPGGAPPAGDAALSEPLDLGLNAAHFAALDNMSPDGSRVFFDSPDALVAQDTNGTDDVYEWEADGTGGCQSSVDNGGCIYLISSGRSGDPSYFENATPSGNDVFFLTRQQLVAQDTDNAVDLYDARVDGGFPAPPAPSAPCSGEDCLGQGSAAPSAPTAASLTFFGPGNGTAARTHVEVRVLRKTVRGMSFIVRVRVPAQGWITISGRGIRTLRRWLARAGTHRLRIALTPRARATLQRSHKFRLRVRVVYVPAGGSSSSVSFNVGVKP